MNTKSAPTKTVNSKTLSAGAAIILALIATSALGVFGSSGATSCDDLGSTPSDSTEQVVIAIDTVGSSQASAQDLASLVEQEIVEAVADPDLSIRLIVDDGRADTPLARPACFADTSFFVERRNPDRETRDREEAVETLVHSVGEVIADEAANPATEGSVLGLLQAAASFAPDRTVVITPARWAGGDCLNLTDVTADAQNAQAIFSGCQQADQLPDFGGGGVVFRGLDRGAHAPEVVAWLSNQMLPLLCDGLLNAECEAT